MKDQQPILGQLIGHDEKRDAIHIAIAPVIAASDLKPGDHIGLVEPGNTEMVDRISSEHIGIVDPFLPRKVKEGERFWMCMYPRSTTGAIRHDWDHPAFTAALAARKMLGADESEAWLRTFANERGLAFIDLIAGAKHCQIHDGDWGGHVCANTDTDVPDEFWDHFARYSGKSVTNRTDYMPCAC